MFQNATVSSRSSSSRTANTCSRNSSMPSLRMRSPLSPKTSYNPLFRPSDFLTSFDASHFVFQEKTKEQHDRKSAVLRRYNSQDSQVCFREVPAEAPAVASPESSPENTGERKLELEAKDFLEKFSLPRVVKVQGGDPLLLYRCFDSFTKIQARGVYSKKGKERIDDKILHFPEGYNGWFSLIGEKGERTAVAYTSVLQLVREQVCSFISIQPFIAYAGHHPDLSEVSPTAKFQYLKTQVKGGQLFQLRAVFQHRDPAGGRMSTKSSRLSKSAKDKDLANRYAQLISQNNQEFYVPLTSKGEFYEIHSSVKAKLCFPGMLDKTGPLALDKDCLYKLTHLLRRVALPVRVKLLAGPLPAGLPKDFTDTFVLERKFQEPLLVTCTLPVQPEVTRHEISCLALSSCLKISRCMLGFESENRLFKSKRLQEALAFCHKNVEAWYRSVRVAPNLQGQQEPPNPPPEGKQLITREVLDKFQKRKRWFGLGILRGTQQENADKAIDRYKDMSKLIEEKFGKKQLNPVKKSASFMFSAKRLDEDDVTTNHSLLKCQSLDTQLFSPSVTKQSSIDSLHDFHLSLIPPEGDAIFAQNSQLPPAKHKPDLIPTLPKHNPFISSRLRSEFHVKTKVQKTKHPKQNTTKTPPTKTIEALPESPDLPPQETTSVSALPTSGSAVAAILAEDVPYGKVADAVSLRAAGKQENIYAEICDSRKNKGTSEYCYVKLGSNGDSVTSDSDEAIYNTLR